MCRARRNYYKRNKGVKVLKKYENIILGVRVELTRKMTIAGNIIYAVVVTNTDTGHRRILNVYNGIQEAFTYYKGAVGQA